MSTFCGNRLPDQEKTLIILFHPIFSGIFSSRPGWTLTVQLLPVVAICCRSTSCWLQLSQLFLSRKWLVISPGHQKKIQTVNPGLSAHICSQPGRNMGEKLHKIVVPGFKGPGTVNYKLFWIWSFLWGKYRCPQLFLDTDQLLYLAACRCGKRCRSWSDRIEGYRQITMVYLPSHRCDGSNRV